MNRIRSWREVCLWTRAVRGAWAATMVCVILMGCASVSQRPDAQAKNLALTQRALQEFTLHDAAAPGTGDSTRIPGVYLGFALNGESSAFQGDIRRVRDSLFLPSAQGPVVLLNNLHPEPVTEAHANFKTIPAVTKAAGQWLRKYVRNHASPALAVVVLSSHGHVDLLSLRIGNEREQSVLRGSYVKDLLDDLGIGPTIVIVSACYSGSFIPTLRAPNRIVITAAAADRNSFGCDVRSAITIFMNSFLDRELDPGLSLRELYDRALVRVAEYEQKTNNKASMPQLSVGSAMEGFAARPIAQWPAALREYRRPSR